MEDQPNRTDNDLLKRQDRRGKGWTDAFGNQISDARANEINIASQYKFSPERLRLFVDGTRQFVQYNSVGQLSDENAIWRLQPNSGAVTLEYLSGGLLSGGATIDIVTTVGSIL